jgi:hypothetical protein
MQIKNRRHVTKNIKEDAFFSFALAEATLYYPKLRISIDSSLFVHPLVE